MEKDWLMSMTLKQSRDMEDEQYQKTNTSIPLLSQTDVYDRCGRSVLSSSYAILLLNRAIFPCSCYRDLNNTGESRILASTLMTTSKALP